MTIVMNLIMDKSKTRRNGDAEKYLDLHSLVGKCRYKAFKILKEKI